MDDLTKLNADPFGISTIKPIAPAFDLAGASAALEDVVTQRKAATAAEIEAAKNNAAIIASTRQQQDVLDADILEAYSNKSRIARYGGENSGLVAVMGLFDKTMNPNVQNTRIMTSNLKSQQAIKRAETQMQINNNLPAILGKEAELATQTFNLYKDTASLYQTARSLDQKDIELKISGVRLNMEVDEATRKAVEFKLRSMSGPQKQQALKMARAGKGEWVPYVGFLEHEMEVDEKNDLDLRNLRASVAKGEQETADASLKRILDRMSPELLSGLVDHGLQTKQGMLEIPMGKGPPIQIPMQMAMTSLIEQQERLPKIQSVIVAQSAQTIQDDTVALATSLASLAGSVPAAGRDLALLSRSREQTDMTNWSQLQQFKAVTELVKKNVAEHAKTAASVYKTAEAKAGIVQYVTNGAFSPEGAEAVVNSTAGNAAASTRAYYSSAYQILNTKIAETAAKQRISGMPSFDGSNTDALVAMATMGRVAPEKLEEIKNQMMADPTIQSSMANAVKGKLGDDAVVLSLRKLESAADANPVWNDVLSHPDVWRDKEGNNSPEMLLHYLMKRTIEIGGKFDLSTLFIDSVNEQSVDQSSLGTLSDPKFTMADRALEAQLFGADPRNSLLGELVTRLRKSSAAIAQTMREQLGNDLSGKTRQKAIFDAGVAAGMGDVPMTDPGIQQMLQNTPSSTGANVTVDRIGRMYGK